ncbi:MULTISPECIES: hypothetical protein [Cryobacterium]|uniref:Uncharacterized protein n=1 Tax=Cryobacterium breve TaxID=1259258 RepID=A0ABY2J1T8_9MICO|nr:MULTISPECIES: hypothetical protein [Cryobacterium]TFC93002.1 hypothetical protein E3T20_11115 [Cryobacterium sp. TmT3-12]TFC98882.1 hypothetical protein E3O65_07020 [Cryobacterium breve]
MGKLGGVALLIVLVFVFTGIVFVTGGGTNSCAVAATISPATVAGLEPVAGYSGDQLVNAAAIITAGAAAGVNVQGQTLGVMTAMGESGLRNIEYGDLAGPDSRGLFQQRDTWGTLAQRLNPTQAAGFFFQRLVKVPNWETLTPTAAAHAVQINADPDHYAPYFSKAEAVVAALVGGDAACAAAVVAGGDAQQLAADLVVKIDAGNITGIAPDHLKEIRWIAAGETHENCGINLAVLQIITVAVNTFGSVGISDINRLCTDQYLGNPNSSHWANGGGHAVDFFSLGRTPTTGADANAIKLLNMLAPLMPEGSATGQVQCRADAGTSIEFAGMNQFEDSCNHVHLQVDPAFTGSLKAAA